MAEAKFDVLTIGNAIVDVLAHAEEDFLVREGLVKGSMRLIDGAEAERLYGHMGPAQLISGGCAGNTAAGVASFGGRAAFIGKVADDELGRFFRHDMQALGIHFPTAAARRRHADGALDDPDHAGRRAHHEHQSRRLPGADPGRHRPCHRRRRGDHLPRRLSLGSAEGEGGLSHRRPASPTRAGRKVAITLSDSFCVDRFRDEFLELMRTGALDIVFANRHEVLSLYQTSDFETAVDCLERDVKLAIVTLSAEGSMVDRRREGASQVAAAPVERVVDLTGAGDLYAAGLPLRSVARRISARGSAAGSARSPRPR